MRRAWRVGLLVAAGCLPACGGGSDQAAPTTSTTARRPPPFTTSTSVVATTSTTPSTTAPSTTIGTTAVPAVAAPIYFLTSLGGAGTVGWYTIGADGRGRRRIYGGEGTEPALAPSRARIAFGRGDEIVVRPLAGTGTTVARAPSGRVARVAWSTDGRTLAFTTSDPAGTYVVPVTGGEPRRLGEQQLDTVAWSPDSRTVAAAGIDGLWLYPVNGAPAVRLRELRAFEVAWSSRDVLAVQLDDKHVHVMGPGGGDDRDVGEGLRPRWSPDGRALAFTGNEGNQTVVAVVPAAGGAPRFLTAPNDRARDVVWSPDGRALAYVSLGQDQVYRLFRASPDDSARRLLTAQQDVELLVW